MQNRETLNQNPKPNMDAPRDTAGRGEDANEGVESSSAPLMNPGGVPSVPDAVAKTNFTPPKPPAAEEPQKEKEGDEMPDPFDPDRLRLSQDFGANLGVRKVLLTVPVRKPSRECWVRTHPDERYRLNTLLLVFMVY